MAKTYAQKNKESFARYGKTLYQRRIENPKHAGLSTRQKRGHASVKRGEVSVKRSASYNVIPTQTFAEVNTQHYALRGYTLKTYQQMYRALGPNRRDAFGVFVNIHYPENGVMVMKSTHVVSLMGSLGEARKLLRAFVTEKIDVYLIRKMSRADKALVRFDLVFIRKHSG
ncbi:MAG: hypothetical protein ACR2OE_01075 [Thermomicrobiales bacterium]